MLLDLEDPKVRAVVRRVEGGRDRLTLDYPAEPRYQDRVMSALADIIRPRGEPLQGPERQR